MEDKKLLELAAKAAGHFLGTDWDCIPDGIFINGDDHFSGIEWNPLTDDGDALRLALQLRIRFARHIQPFVAAFAPDTVGRFEESEGDDICAATRRAITRAAAQIGKEME